VTNTRKRSKKSESSTEPFLRTEIWFSWQIAENFKVKSVKHIWIRWNYQHRDSDDKDEIILSYSITFLNQYFLNFLLMKFNNAFWKACHFLTFKLSESCKSLDKINSKLEGVYFSLCALFQGRCESETQNANLIKITSFQ